MGNGIIVVLALRGVPWIQSLLSYHQILTICISHQDHDILKVFPERCLLPLEQFDDWGSFVIPEATQSGCQLQLNEENRGTLGV